MSVRIEKRYQAHLPINIERMVRKLLDKVPGEHLIGLDVIIIVDTVSHRRDKKSEGLYWPKKGQEQAKIEIAVDAIYKGMPRIVFYLPFVAELMLASVIYHEVGHHYQYQTHGITKREREDFAEKYKKQMLKKAFFWWRAFSLPFSPLVNWLKRHSQGGREKGKSVSTF